MSWGTDSVVVTVFPDSNKKYLSTDLLNHQELKADYLTPEITVGRLPYARTRLPVLFRSRERREPQ